MVLAIVVALRIVVALGICGWLGWCDHSEPTTTEVIPVRQAKLGASYRVQVPVG